MTDDELRARVQDLVNHLECKVTHSYAVDELLKLCSEVRAAERARFPKRNAVTEGGLTAAMIMQHYPMTQHQPDECQLCAEVFEIAAEAIERGDGEATAPAPTP